MAKFGPIWSHCSLKTKQEPGSGAANQGDQIGRFITLWATFQSQWQQLFCPNFQHILGNLCKFVKIFHFSSKFFLGNFYRHLATFYWSHCCQLFDRVTGNKEKSRLNMSSAGHRLAQSKTFLMAKKRGAGATGGQSYKAPYDHNLRLHSRTD